MPKIIGESLADHRSLTRRRLFEALGDLLAEQSFDTITMSQIAERAEVGRTAVYNHFADKEVLLLAYMRQVTSEFTEVLQEALEGENDPIEQLRIYLRSHLEITARYHVASSMNLRRQMSRENSEHLADHAGIIGHVLLHILDAAMRTGAIPRQNPLALVSLIHSSLAGQRLPLDPKEREASLVQVETFILRGIGVCPEKVAATALTDEGEAAALVTELRAEDARRSDAERDAAAMRCPMHH
ncbi:TetR/AcrR family transcriptional regulator [Schaalia vaccimaxillae]|uniref:TetR/AcrR family transcriptional regulator n=1 Tax=Schaalia vaccimaxillae TaxID=183916 RepID=UPI0003B75A2E|nr:TetR/AcrR family transcriptional regulator [Schaalia vaccimaxillae]